MKINIGLFCIGIAVSAMVLLNKMDIKAAQSKGRVESMMQSSNMLEIYDEVSDKTIVIDYADFRYLASQIDEMNAVFGR